MTWTIHFENLYPNSNVKELLEEHLLIPRKMRHFLRVKKHLQINGKNINWQSQVKTHDMISLTFDEKDYAIKTIPFGNPTLVDCLYEDEHIIIVNKPEGLKTHGNAPNDIALLNHVSAYVGQTCYVVHRLDMETSGAIVFAKNPFILPLLNRLLEKRAIKRTYWALVDGKFPNKQVTYKDKIGRHRHDRRKRIVDKQNGQVAITHVTRLKNYNTLSLVKCQLDTGRTHQIRVHLSHHGHSIIGDPLYSHQNSDRLMLHAHHLTLRHPITLEKITVTAPSHSFEKELEKLTK